MYYLIILVLLFLAELFYFRIADKYNIIDKPNERSSHTRITLRGGGIIFYFGALAYFLSNEWEYPWFMLALTLITFISFVRPGIPTFPGVSGASATPPRRDWPACSFSSCGKRRPKGTPLSS